MEENMKNDLNFVGNAKKMKDFLGKEWEYNCLGCAISEGKVKVPGGFIYESDKIVIGQDPEIPIKGFLIVNVKRHINSISELNKEERFELMEAIYEAIKALKQLNISKEVTIVQEERSKHLHIWIFPNDEWMNKKFGKGITYLRDISSYAQKNATQKDIDEILDTIKKLKDYFKDYKFRV